MTEQSAALVWALGIVGWLIIRWPYRRRAKRTETVADNSSIGERVSLGLTILGLVLLPIAHLTTGVFSFANVAYSPLAGWFGMLTMSGFLIIFYLSHKHLARNWSVTLEIRKDHNWWTPAFTNARGIRCTLHSGSGDSRNSCSFPTGSPDWQVWQASHGYISVALNTKKP